MRLLRQACIALVVTVLVVGMTPGLAPAAESARHVVDATAIQARIDRQIDTERADREAILLLLQRPEVRAIAGGAGLDIERAGASVSVLSGAELADAAARAGEINNALVGGTSTVVISTTALIIILLLIIIVAS